MIRLIAKLTAAAVLVGTAWTQTTNSQFTPPTQSKLAFIIPDVLDSAVQSLDPVLQSTIRAAVSPSYASLNTAIVSELANLPLPSPASEQRHILNSTGSFSTVPQSFGPILSERAETIGAGKAFFALTVQRFQFDRLDDLDLRNFQVSIPVQIPAGTVAPFPINGLINSASSLSLNLTEVTAHFTYGLDRKTDVSFALPSITSSLSFRTSATFRELQTGLLLAGLPKVSLFASATGLGDAVVRVKRKLVEGGTAHISAVVDFRLPTGDEFNYHGAGAYGIKPFLVASITTESVSPHINVGYLRNGESYLASTNAREKAHLPDQAFFAVGLDARLSQRATFSGDILDQIVINGQRSFLRDEQTSTGITYQNVYFPNETRHEVNGAAGLKVRIYKNLVAMGNLLFRLNQAGLRSRVVPSAGLSYIY